MAHRVAPISVSVALGHMSANAVKATIGGWSTGNSACLTFPLLGAYLKVSRPGEMVIRGGAQLQSASLKGARVIFLLVSFLLN